MTLAEFLEHLGHWKTVKASPFEPIEFSASLGRLVVCECDTPNVWLRHQSFTHGTIQEVTAAYIGQCSECLRIC